MKTNVYLIVSTTMVLFTMALATPVAAVDDDPSIVFRYIPDYEDGICLSSDGSTSYECVKPMDEDCAVYHGRTNSSYQGYVCDTVYK